MMWKRLGAVAAAIGLASVGVARADTIVYIDDANNNIGQVDITTQSVVAGSVHATGLANLFDLGFNSAGTLYGTTVTSLYTISPTTGASTLVGTYTVGGAAMNALVGSGGLGLLAASAATNAVYAINQTNASATTYSSGVAPSAGDLAFSGSTLYEAASTAAGPDELVNVTSGTVVGLFRVGSTSGATLSTVFGLANNGTTTYAVAGTTVYSVNLTNGVLTALFDYGSNTQGLGAANGTAFLGESSGAGGGSPVPEPMSAALVGAALAGFAAMRTRRG